MGNGIIVHPAHVLKSRFKADWVNLSLAILGFLPLLVLFFLFLWGRATYQFFPLALVGVGMLVGRVLKQTEISYTAESLRNKRLIGLLTIALFFGANYLWSPWLAFVAFLTGLVAVFWVVGGRSLLRSFAPALLLLVAIVPPPFGWDQQLTLWLRSVAMHVCSSLLDCLNISFAKDGNTLQLPEKTLFVEEACSGINSFILCNVFCLFWILWQRRPLWWLLLALPVTSLFVMLGNIIRITVGAAGFYFWRVDLLNGWRHETFGLVLLLIYCSLILSLDQLLVFINRPVSSRSLRPIGPASKPVVPAVGPAPADVQGGSVLGFRFCGVLIAIIGLAAGAIHVRHMSSQQLISILSSFKASREFKLSLPQKIGRWERINGDTGDLAMVETMGVHSIAWHFRSEAIVVALAVDYPLDGFHNVSVCYQGNGWGVVSEAELKQHDTSELLHTIKLTLKKPLRHGVVFHSVVNEQGTWIDAPSSFETRLDYQKKQTGFRVQLFLESYAPLSVAEESAVEQLFFEARALLVPQIVDEVNKTRVK